MAAEQLLINIAGQTDVGARKNNEDAFLIADFRAGHVFPEAFRQTRHINNNHFLLAVSDGVGGAAVGEMASQLTVHSINDSLCRLSQAIPAYDRLVASVEQANYIVWHESQRTPQYRGMSATITAVLVEKDRAYIAEVGDSRAYLLRKDRATQLTTDQSLVEVLLAKGLLTPEQALHHPRKNVILQAVGLAEVLQIAVGQLLLQNDDYLLLCSDGLSNNVLENEMVQIVKNSANLPIACQQLVDLANERGGKDNITVVIAHFEGEALPRTSSRELNKPAVEMITTFDPDRDAEKTHKRTMLLSNPAICVIQEEMVLEDLKSYPRSAQINEQYQQLNTIFNQALRLIAEQQTEIEQVHEWIKVQQARYARMEDLDSKLASAQEHIEEAWRTIREISGEFGTK